MSKPKVSSGIEGLDRLLYGGFPAGKAYLVSGEPGTGKTIFTLQYLLEGIRGGEKGAFISIDERPEHIIADAESLGWNILEYLETGLLKIFDITAYFGSQHGKEADVDITRIIDAIIQFAKDNQVQRLVIDPVAPLILAEKNIPEVGEYIRKLIFELEGELRCTTLLTSHVPVGSESFSYHGIEEFAASGIVLLRLSKINNKYIRTILIRKMRGTRIDLSEYSFEILPDRGIVLRQPV